MNVLKVLLTPTWSEARGKFFTAAKTTSSTRWEQHPQIQGSYHATAG